MPKSLNIRKGRKRREFLFAALGGNRPNFLSFVSLCSEFFPILRRINSLFSFRTFTLMVSATRPRVDEYRPRCGSDSRFQSSLVVRPQSLLSLVIGLQHTAPICLGLQSSGNDSRLETPPVNTRNVELARETRTSRNSWSCPHCRHS